jgi:phosphoribosylformimino-5-aminoimidazole carboxamide ribotide isomerase
MLDEFGSTIVVGIDAHEGKVATRGWEKVSETDALALAQQMAELGVERIVYTDIARDGMLGGVNLEATREIAETTGLRVTCSGGVSTLDDIFALLDLENSESTA